MPATRQNATIAQDEMQQSLNLFEHLNGYNIKHIFVLFIAADLLLDEITNFLILAHIYIFN